MSKPNIPIVSRANLLRMFVEGALGPEAKMRACALRALNKQLGVYPGHKGEFTIHQAERLLEAAHRNMDDPVNQIDLTRPMLVRKGGGLRGR